MNRQTLEFVSGLYDDQNIGFAYFQDKYAVELLRYALQNYQLENGANIAEVKKWKQGFLLSKKPLKNITASLKKNRLQMADLVNYQPQGQLPFSITFDKWGAFKKHRKDTYYQTTRPGYSLVLQLNFSEHHDVPYYKLVNPKRKAGERDGHPLRWTCHPVCENNQLTLGWVRLDFDLETGETLIEEIQTDWLRDAKRLYHFICEEEDKEPKKRRFHWILHAIHGTAASFKQYYETVLQPYSKVWDEALLSAAIWFSIEEMGIRDIYYHTYESGCLLKDCKPPRSLYTKLPRRFGFQKTDNAPVFIQNNRYLKKTLRTKNLAWWRLHF